MATSPFYDLGPLEQVAVNLFNGWGYNFYRRENQLRADDLLVRAKVGALMGSARKSVEIAEREYRREFLPPPSRERPTFDPAALAAAQGLERLSKEIGALAGQINSAPVPENDRMTQRYRKEAETLLELTASDKLLVGQAELLRSMLDQKDGAWMVGKMDTLHEGVMAIAETLRRRQMLLFPVV